MIKYVFRLSQLSVIILLFQMLAISFGLTIPSSRQYLYELKNVGTYNITRLYHGIPFTIITVIYS